MRKYELVCVVHPDQDENALNSLLEKLKGWVAESGGKVDKVDLWGRRQLAYPIRKQRDGNYVLLTLTLDPAAAAGLERNIRFQEAILRHMLILAE